MMKGEKAPFRKYWIRFPAAGVPEDAISKSVVFGEIIRNSMQDGSLEDLQPKLASAGAVPVDPVLFNIEKRGKMMFGIWANMLLKKGAYNDPAREGRLRLFKYYLFTVIYLISPFVSLLFRVIFLFNRRKAGNIIKEFSDLQMPSQKIKIAPFRNQSFDKNFRLNK
jgi:hypothetical protein